MSVKCACSSISLSLLVTHLKCEGHADVSHNELVLLQVATKLDKGELDVRGGVIAGAVLIENIQAHGKEENVIVTVHRCQCSEVQSFAHQTWVCRFLGLARFPCTVIIPTYCQFCLFQNGVLHGCE